MSSGPLTEEEREGDIAGRHEMLAFIYVFSICGVATMLFVAVNAIEPNRRYASALKLLIVFVSAAAIAGRLMP